MALNTARISVVRGRPPAFAGGMWGDTSAHCGSVRSEGYRIEQEIVDLAQRPAAPSSEFLVQEQRRPGSPGAATSGLPSRQSEQPVWP